MKRASGTPRNGLKFLLGVLGVSIIIGAAIVALVVIVLYLIAGGLG